MQLNLKGHNHIKQVDTGVFYKNRCFTRRVSKILLSCTCTQGPLKFPVKIFIIIIVAVLQPITLLKINSFVSIFHRFWKAVQKTFFKERLLVAASKIYLKQRFLVALKEGRTLDTSPIRSKFAKQAATFFYNLFPRHCQITALHDYY